MTSSHNSNRPYVQWLLFIPVIFLLTAVKPIQSQNCPRQGCLICTSQKIFCTGGPTYNTCPRNAPRTVTEMTLTGTRGRCGQTLTTSSLRFLTELEKLSMPKSAYNVITSDAFLMNVKLQYLVINKGVVKVIETGAFRGLTQLKMLDLSWNKLTDNSFRGPSPFTKLASLRTLLLNNNQITNITNIFLRGLNNLEELNLASNGLTSISVDAFNDLTSLKLLYLNSNALTQFTPDTWFGRTVRQTIFATIDVSSNRITHINHSHLTGMKAKVLNVANNPLQSFSVGKPRHIKIQSLVFEGTQLTSLEPNVDRVLTDPATTNYDGRYSNVYLKNVQNWVCNCDSLWLATFLATHPSSTSPVCGSTGNASPQLNGQLLVNATGILRLVCIITSTTSSSTATTIMTTNKTQVTIASTTLPANKPTTIPNAIITPTPTPSSNQTSSKISSSQTAGAITTPSQHSNSSTVGISTRTTSTHANQTTSMGTNYEHHDFTHVDRAIIITGIVFLIIILIILLIILLTICCHYYKNKSKAHPEIRRKKCDKSTSTESSQPEDNITSPENIDTNTENQLNDVNHNDDDTLSNYSHFMAFGQNPPPINHKIAQKDPTEVQNKLQNFQNDINSNNNNNKSPKSKVDYKSVIIPMNTFKGDRSMNTNSKENLSETDGGIKGTKDRIHQRQTKSAGVSDARRSLRIVETKDNDLYFQRSSTPIQNAWQ